MVVFEWFHHDVMKTFFIAYKDYSDEFGTFV